MSLSDQASGTQDVAALGIITAAGVAAGALLYDAPLALVKGAGLGAGTIAATTAYFRPGDTSTALLAAAEQLVCIRKAAEPVQHSLSDSDDAIEIVTGAIQSVRLNLRKKLNRTMPDYSSVVASLQKSATLPGMQIVPVDNSINILRNKVALCILTAV
jgi:hypothetical protein